jgi:hypothetical protein
LVTDAAAVRASLSAIEGAAIRSAVVHRDERDQTAIGYAKHRSRSHDFVCPDGVAFPVAMCISNPDCSAFGIHS